MWLSRQMKAPAPTADADLGMTTIAGDSVGVVTRGEVLKAQGEELSRQAGGLSPFLTAFFSGRRLTQKEAEELKQLIDQHTWEG